MVATHGAGWALAPCLRVLVEQLDAAYPERPRQSDGTIGDRSHASRTSDHNVADGLVCALDITDWPGGRFDPDDWARTYAVHDPRVKYLISDGRIWSRGRAAEGWRAYDGANPHDKHLHVSCTTDGARIVSPWAGIGATKPSWAPGAPRTKEDYVTAIYIRHTEDGRVARLTPDTQVHLSPAELAAENALAGVLVGAPIKPVPVYPPVWDGLVSSRLDIRALNDAARRAR